MASKVRKKVNAAMRCRRAMRYGITGYGQLKRLHRDSGVPIDRIQRALRGDQAARDLILGEQF